MSKIQKTTGEGTVLCGTPEVHRQLLKESPEYAEARQEIEEHMESYARNARAGERDMVKIPVVVHVVWNTQEQNISEEQIKSQIDVLNLDFRKQNPDVSNVPDAFKDLAADAKLEFYLATKDPEGNPTNGITRTQTSHTTFSTDHLMKSSASGGADPWPSDRYLNIWVCRLGGGLLGYATFPGGPADIDGVVILDRAFGTVGTAQNTPQFNLGRTATHEIGHWLNLYHIWGDDGNACTGSDQVDDTPNQAGPSRGVPNFPHISCGNGPNGDMFMNYMDYTDDRGMFMFTVDQVKRIDACLIGPRNSFLQQQTVTA